jgi:hypothetical protein
MNTKFPIPKTNSNGNKNEYSFADIMKSLKIIRNDIQSINQWRSVIGDNETMSTHF